MSQTKKEYDKFILVTERILSDNLDIGHVTLKEYRWQIIEAYNLFVQFVSEHYFKVSIEKQRLFNEKLRAARAKFEECLNTLGCTYVLPEGLYETIDAATIGEVPIRRSEAEIKLELEETRLAREKEKLEQERERIRIERLEQDRAEQERLYRVEQERLERELLELERLEREQRRAANMSDQLKAQKELLDIVNGQIRKPYSGDPMGLQTFITSVGIVRDFARNAELRSKLFMFLKGKLEGRAREVITDDITTVDEMLVKLKRSIVPENSKVIEGRISSLRYSYAKQEEFATRVEELADALRRTLIIEGMTPEKANDMTIDRTIQLCKRSTRSEVVKAVLSAAKFNTSKEVVAKLITCGDECMKEQQVMRFANGNRGRGNGNFNNFNNSDRGRGGFRGGRGNYFDGRRFDQNNRHEDQQWQENDDWQSDNQYNVRMARSDDLSEL